VPCPPASIRTPAHLIHTRSDHLGKSCRRQRVDTTQQFTDNRTAGTPLRRAIVQTTNPPCEGEFDEHRNARPGPGRPGGARNAATPAGDTLFTGSILLTVQTPIEVHQTKKRSGSSDGAQTYDTPITCFLVLGIMGLQ
jgi:hypothetical protein